VTITAMTTNLNVFAGRWLASSPLLGMASSVRQRGLSRGALLTGRPVHDAPLRRASGRQGRLADFSLTFDPQTGPENEEDPSEEGS
jgi:hypothetical protein